MLARAVRVMVRGYVCDGARCEGVVRVRVPVGGVRVMVRGVCVTVCVHDVQVALN